MGNNKLNNEAPENNTTKYRIDIKRLSRRRTGCSPSKGWLNSYHDQACVMTIWRASSLWPVAARYDRTLGTGCGDVIEHWFEDAGHESWEATEIH